MCKKLLLLGLLTIISAGQLEATDLVIDKDDSTIYAKVRATGHKFEAKVTDFTCDFILTDDGARPASIDFTLDFKDLKTGLKPRDKEMLHWLEYEKYPKLRFRFSKFRHVAGIDVMIGNLSFHNHTQSIQIPFKIAQNGRHVKITGNTSLDYTDFKLELIKMLFFKVHPSLEIHFELNGELHTEMASHE